MARREIHTEIEVATPIERVWEVLTDFESYPRWNPFVQRLSGVLQVGEALHVELRLGARTMRISPTVRHVDQGHAFRWLGHLLVRGLFDGEHAFELEPVDEQRTLFVHRERFSGLLVGLTLRMIGDQTRAAFVAMNEALKNRCETGSESDPSSA